MENRQLRPEEDPSGIGLMLRLTDGVVEMGLCPVMYGWRVRAGWLEANGGPAMAYHCDWCCGDNPKLVMAMYRVMKIFLEAGVDLTKLPTHSEVKPLWKDRVFLNTIVKLGVDFRRITSPLGGPWTYSRPCGYEK